MIHPRVNLHQVAFGTQSTTAFIDHCRAIGVPNMTLVTPHLMQPGGVEEALTALAPGGPKATVVNHPFGFFPNLDEDDGRATTQMLEAIDIADRLGAKLMYLVTGGRGKLLWEDAAERFATLIAPCLPVAAEKGIMLTVESASPFNVDIHIAHTLDDTIRLAEIAGCASSSMPAGMKAGSRRNSGAPCRSPGWSRSAIMSPATAPRRAAR